MKQYPEWVYQGYTELKPIDTDRKTYRKDYGQTGKCTVKWCRNPNSWWTCYNCGNSTCKAHQEFDWDVGIVIKCYYCNGTKKWQRLFQAQLRKNARQNK